MKNLIIKPIKDILTALGILEAKYNPNYNSNVSPGQTNNKIHPTSKVKL